MEIDYDVVADAIHEEEKKNKWKNSGTVRVELDGVGEILVFYEIQQLEGYEEPCYNVESSRCGPGGYFDLDAYYLKATAVDTDDNDVEIDDYELSIAYTETMNGDSSNNYYVDDYFANVI